MSGIARFTSCRSCRIFLFLPPLLLVFLVLSVGCSSSEEDNRQNEWDPTLSGFPASGGTGQSIASSGFATDSAPGQSNVDASLPVADSSSSAFDATRVALDGQDERQAATGGSSDVAGQSAAGGATDNAGQGGAAGNTLPTGGMAGSVLTGGVGGSVATDNQLSLTPFGCDFAWGTNDPGGSLISIDYLDFITKWVGYEVDSSGAISQCDGCWWLSNQVAETQLVPVFYAYFIGFFGKANGLPDGNEAPNAPNLTTHASALIKSHRSQIIQMYSQYAQQAYRVWSERPLIWLLEGDFVQYTEDIQTDPLTMTELGQLAADITTAIKTNMPNAVVSINHTTWNSDEETDAFWQSMQDASVAYDMVWTTGVANNNGYIESSGNSTYYNSATARYEYIHQLTGRNIFVDTSFGISAMADTWAAADATTLNARIAEGVIAANVVNIPGDYANRIAALAALLDSPCE